MLFQEIFPPLFQVECRLGSTSKSSQLSTPNSLCRNEHVHSHVQCASCFAESTWEKCKLGSSPGRNLLEHGLGWGSLNNSPEAMLWPVVVPHTPSPSFFDSYIISSLPSSGVTATAATDPATQPDRNECKKEAFSADGFCPSLLILAKSGK